MASYGLLLSSIFLLFAVDSLSAAPADHPPVPHFHLTAEQNTLQVNGFIDTCSAGNNTWQCCVGAEFELDVIVCAFLEYLPDEYGIRANLTFDDKVLVTYVLSAKNPPPICANLEEVADFCIRFYDLDATTEVLRGCARLEGQLYKFDVIKLEIGCFEIPIKSPGRAENFQRIDNSVQHANKTE